MGKDQKTMTEATIALGSTYSHDDSIRAVVDRVLSKHTEKFRHLITVKLAALRRDSKAADDAFSVDGAGGAFVRNDRERGIAPDYDAGVWFRSRFWEAMEDEAREAWVFHQLCHLAPRPSGEGIAKIGHDVEAFTDEAYIFGAWDEQLSLFAQNLDRHASGAKPKRVRAAKPAADAATEAGDPLPN